MHALHQALWRHLSRKSAGKALHCFVWPDLEILPIWMPTVKHLLSRRAFVRPMTARRSAMTNLFMKACNWFDQLRKSCVKVAKKKKISYAASIGTDQIDQPHCAQIKTWLNDFSAISVREIQTAKQLSELSRSGLQILLYFTKRHFGLNSQQMQFAPRRTTCCAIFYQTNLGISSMHQQWLSIWS